MEFTKAKVEIANHALINLNFFVENSNQTASSSTTSNHSNSEQSTALEQQLQSTLDKMQLVRLKTILLPPHPVFHHLPPARTAVQTSIETIQR